MNAIVVASQTLAEDLVTLLDNALGYPNATTAHATFCFQHYGEGDQPWAVVVDDACAEAAAAWPEVPAPETLTADWWPPRGI